MGMDISELMHIIEADELVVVVVDLPTPDPAAAPNNIIFTDNDLL